MDKKNYDEEFDDELVDDELSSYEIIEENETSDFHSQNLNSKIRDIRRQNKGNQNTINRLNQRKANTMSKGVESSKSTPSTSNSEEIPEQDEPEQNKLEKKNQEISNKIQETAKKVANQAKETVKTTVKETSKKIALTIAKNPYVWVAVGIFILIMLIPILWGAYDGDGGKSGGSSNGVTYVEGYEACKSITVEGSGTYPLEDYVAGVIEHEAYKDGGEEALKAQAVAARTYAINSTNNCTTAIGNSQASQTFSESPSDIAKAAATATAGQVLTYDGKIFSAMYDSFCYSDSDCPDSVKNADGSYTVTYTKKPNNEKHKITLSQEKQYGRIVPGGGHASGMSQLVSYQMASEGKKYDEILYFFYSDGVEISAITKANASSLLGEFNGKFTIRTDKPDWLSVPDSNYYLKQGSNNFQCVWYARYRAYEILSTMTGDIDETKRQKAKDTLLAAGAHGSGWYDIAQNGGTMSIFESSDDYMKPRPGAMVSYKWTSSGCINYHGVNCDSNNYNYGHVALIESVDYENQKVIITDGGMKCENWNNKDCFGFKYRELTFEQMKNFGGNNYIFLGYVYVADYPLNSNIGTIGNSNIAINLNNSGSTSNGNANTCSSGKVDTTQPDPAIAVNYWQSKGTISSSNFIYPTDKETGYKLGAHPKNFNYSNLANPNSYYDELIWPVTPSNGKYSFGYEHNGIDISAYFGTPIYALGNGKLIYSEWGHTVNKGCDETAYSVTMELDNPVIINGKKVKKIFITHMSGIVYYCPMGNCNKTVKKGELLGFIGHASGTAAEIGTWAPHLHMSLYDNEYSAGLTTNEIEKIYNISSGNEIVAGG